MSAQTCAISCSSGSGKDAYGVICQCSSSVVVLVASGCMWRSVLAPSIVSARAATEASSSVGTTASTMPLATRFSASCTPSGKGHPLTVS